MVGGGVEGDTGAGVAGPEVAAGEGIGAIADGEGDPPLLMYWRVW